jgi:hypothetical protein
MWFYSMIAILLRWHKAISWKLGQSDANRGRPYNRPWWVNEAYYALAYTHARLIKITPAGKGVSPRLTSKEIRSAL